MTTSRVRVLIVSLLFLLALVAVLLAYQMDQDAEQHISQPALTNTGALVECYTDADCVVTGCSNTVCAPRHESETKVTTCEYREEYACYIQDNCLCQSNVCQWEGNDLFTTCIDELDQVSCNGLSGQQLEQCEQAAALDTRCDGLAGDAYVSCIRGETTTDETK